MANFWKQLKEWFKEEDASSPTKPFIEGRLLRTEAEKEDLKKWKLSSLDEKGQQLWDEYTHYKEKMLLELKKRSQKVLVRIKLV